MKQILLYFSLFRSYSFLSLSSPVYYFLLFLLSILLLCLSLHILYFSFILLSLSLSVFYFISSCFLSFSSDFLCLSSTFSFGFCLFLCLLLSFLVFFHFFPLPVSYYVPLLSNLSFLHICVFCYYYPILLFCSLYLPIFHLSFLLIFLQFFFLFCFSYFVLFSTLYDYRVLILDFNYCKFSLLFIFL